MKPIVSTISNKITLLIGVVLLPMASVAQQGAVNLTLTLDKARTIALANNPEILAGAVDAKINKEQIAEARLKRIPQIYADYNVQRNLIIPVTPVPSNAFNPNAPEGQITPLRFATKWTSNTGINASLDLFNPQKKQAVQEALIKEKITALENANLSNNISFEVGKAYLECLIASEQLRLAIADTVTKSGMLKITKQQFNEGRLQLSTLNQAMADRNNVLNNWEEASKIFSSSKSQLLYFLGFTPEDNQKVEFLDNLEGLFKTYQKNSDTSALNSNSYNKLSQNKTLLNTQIKGAVKGYLPSVILKGYYGANYYDNSFDLFKSSNWNGNSFVNLGIRVPITEGLERQKKIAQLRLQKEAYDLRYQAEKNKNRLDFLSAVQEAEMFEKKYLRSQENLKLAEKNVLLAQQQYENGRLLMNDLYQITYNYQKEKNTYLTTAYNYILSALTVEKLRRY